MAFNVSGSVKTGPNIKDIGNLAFYIDLANPNSYNPSRNPSTLFSMVPGGKDANLYYSASTFPYYTTQYGGGMAFSTASQQRFLIDPVPLTTESFAVEVWFKAGKSSTSNGWETIIGCGDVVSGQISVPTQRGWSITYIGNTTRVRFGASVTSSAGPASVVTDFDSSNALTVGQVYNLLLQRNTINQTLELYKNGTLWQSITLNNTGSLGGSPNQIGTTSWQDGPGDLYMNHTYYSMKMYTNTQFTAAEVQQNFNAVRNKFRI